MLAKILTEIQKFNKTGLKSLVVFDLDSTLFDVSPRLERILLDFAEDAENQTRFPQHIPLLKNIKTLRTDWGIKGALERVGLDQYHPEFHEAIKQFWLKNFFSNDYLEYDTLYEGALEFVQAIDKTGAEISYLTGRDVERMGQGSKDILLKWGFPLHEKASLVLKPHRNLDDAQFKTDWFIEMDKRGFEKIFFFENEPVNLHHLSQHCPHVEMIFFDSTHSGNAHPPENIPKIINFLIPASGE